jgi:hypothetical protein
VLGRLVLVVSGLGFPLSQAVIARFGRRGAVVAEGVALGLLVRDAALVAMGTPRRLRRWPAILLWLELIAAAGATVAGLAAVARPGQVVDHTRAGRAEAVRRFTVGLLFGLHTYRFQIYLRPDRGLADALATDSAGRRSSRPTPEATGSR